MSAAGILRFLGSAKLAIWLVIVVILFAAAGAIIPQEGLFDTMQIDEWKSHNPGFTKIINPIGLFHVFRSYPFLVVIFLLWLNIFICTILYIKNEGGIRVFLRPGYMRIGGFTLIHISLLLLLIGGALSTAATMDGYIILTEGQVFKEHPNHYLHLQQGPLFFGKHKEFEVRLKKTSDTFSPDGYLLQSEAVLQFSDGRDEPVVETIRVNEPYTFSNVAFTIDQTGYSPRIIVKEKPDNRVILHSFVALKTFKEGLNQREYRDYIRSPALDKRFVITLEDPLRRILRVDAEGKDGDIQTKYARQGKEADFDSHSLGLTGLRRWASFRVMEDPGYPIILIALWLGIVGLGMRYLPEIAGWFASPGD